MATRMRQPDVVRVRIEHLLWLLAACYLALVARLVYLQAINGEFYRDKARRMRAERIPLISDRGALITQDGKPIAVTVHRSELVCDPTQITNPQKTAETLSRMTGRPAGELLPYLQPGRLLPNGRADRRVTLPITVESAIVEAIGQARLVRKTARSLDGIAVVTERERSYPERQATVHIAGFTVPDRAGKPVGKMGLEQSLESVLRGTDGYVLAEVDNRQRVIPDTQVTRVPSANGLNVRLTIDSTVQHIAQQALETYCFQHKPLGATAIVLDPHTGDVLALVSYPSFDPVTRAELKQGLEPLSNRGLELLEPGSTMKIFTAAAALEQGVITRTTGFYCPGSLKIGNRKVKCAAHGGSSAHGHETIREVIEHSCNVASAQIGVMVGMDRLRPYLERFGLLDQTGIGLPRDMRGRLGFDAASESDRSATKVSRVAFGQSIMVSPLAMAAAYGAIANGGVLMKPRLIAAYEDARGRVVRSFPPSAVRQAVKPETAAYLRELLEAVVTSGTGKGKANVPGFSVAGKTGTAQKVVKGQRGYAVGKYVASFIGFLPVRSPRAVVYVVIDEPSGAYYGAQVAAPIFQDISERLMWYWKVPPDDPGGLSRVQVAGR